MARTIFPTAWMVSVALSVTVVACGDGESPEPGSGTVPGDLLAIEGSAEDAFDLALAGDLITVATDAKAIEQTWGQVRPEMESHVGSLPAFPVMDQAVAGLRAITTAEDPTRAARAANAISAPMAELFAIYLPTVPPAVLSLDYLGREVVLDGREADVTKGNGHVDTIATTWASLRAAVVSVGGSAEAAAYDASIAALRADLTNNNHAQLVVDANAGLEIIDAIEGKFAP
jgi:hypothetical protein